MTNEQNIFAGEGVGRDQDLRQCGDLFRNRAVSEEKLPYVVELLACCTNYRERAAVCLVKYRGLRTTYAGKLLGITQHQVEDALTSVAMRRNVAAAALLKERAIRRQDKSAQRDPGRGVEIPMLKLEQEDTQRDTAAAAASLAGLADGEMSQQPQVTADAPECEL